MSVIYKALRTIEANDGRRDRRIDDFALDVSEGRRVSGLSLALMVTAGVVGLSAMVVMAATRLAGQPVGDPVVEATVAMADSSRPQHSQAAQSSKPVEGPVAASQTVASTPDTRSHEALEVTTPTPSVAMPTTVFQPATTPKDADKVRVAPPPTEPPRPRELTVAQAETTPRADPGAPIEAKVEVAAITPTRDNRNSDESLDRPVEMTRTIEIRRAPAPGTPRSPDTRMVADETGGDDGVDVRFASERPRVTVTRTSNTYRVQYLKLRLSDALESGQHDEVLPILSELQRIVGADSAFMLKTRAYVQLAMDGNIPHAMELLREAMARDPRDTEAAINMAVAEIKIGEPQLARKRLQGLVLLHPNDVRITSLLKSLK